MGGEGIKSLDVGCVVVPFFPAVGTALVSFEAPLPARYTAKCAKLTVLRGKLQRGPHTVRVTLRVGSERPRDCFRFFEHLARVTLLLCDNKRSSLPAYFFLVGAVC